MINLKDSDKIIIEKYPNADYIYSLARKKAKWNKGEKVAEAAVFLFTPLVNAINQAHALSDMAIYYLVEQNNKQFLVRVDKMDKNKDVEVKDITGEFTSDTYISGNDKFEKIRHIKHS